jgi:hypothetical protein
MIEARSFSSIGHLLIAERGALREGARKAGEGHPISGDLYPHRSRNAE